MREWDWDWDWVIGREYETGKAVLRVFTLSFTVSMGRDILLSRVMRTVKDTISALLYKANSV